MRDGRWVGLWLVLGSVIVAGCGNPDAPPVSGSMEEATVTGTVKVRGKPVSGGKVSFRCSNINRPNVTVKEADINKDGTYTAKTLVGQNFVEVSCRELLTPQNRVLSENEQMIDIKSGENQLDINIPPLPPAAK